MRFTKAALWLLASSIASTITTNAFQAPTSSSSSSLLLLPSRSISLLQQQQQSNGDDDTVGSSTNQQQQQQQQQQQNKRKPRFAQDAHARSSGTVRPKVAAAAAAAVVRQQQQQQQLANNGNDSWQDAVPRTKAPQTQTPQSNNRGSAPSTKSPPRKPPRVFTGTFDDDDDNDDNHYDNRTNNNNGNSNSEIQNDFMWKTGKSIDDLENSMTSRFGTNQQQWAADPSEYELEDATTAASNFGRKTNNNNSDNIKNPTVSKSGKFNGKPVLDPWQRQEQTKKRSKKEKFEAETTAAAAPSSMFDVKSDEGYILNRARRNQQPKSEENRKRRPKWADLVDEFDDTGSTDSTDFYDEDDEGYEAPGRNDNDVGKLISHKPVGGRGTFKATTTSSSSSSGTRPVPKPQDASPGYFFNANAVREEAADEDAAAAAAKKPPRKRIRIPPMMDDNDNAIYLTTEQADRNFKAALKASGVNDLDDDDNNNNSDTEEEPTAWNELGITSERLLTNLETMGCPSPLSVQEKSCASILTGNDVLVGTYTGSGKTLAFLVPLVQQLLLDDQTADGLAILVVAPGRELASQITSVARSLLEGTGLSVVLAIGGTTFSRNLEQIRKKKPTIVVGTPGRIAELVVGQPGQKGGRMKIASLQSIVLDEFDALLEYKPHRDPTAAIMAALKRRHRDSLQSILCSATATDMAGSAQLNSYLRPGYTTAMADVDDRLITAGDEKNAVTRVSRTVMHGVVHVSRQQLALDTIRKVLHTEPVPQQVLIFADNARRVDLVVEKLAQMDIIAAALHGGAKSEKMDRAEVSKALREGYVGIVVATELAARGLDAPLLTHVINLDLPTDASHYAHRAGRCGRGGRPGVVVNITTEPKQRNVPKKFADKLGVDMFAVEPRAGKLLVLEAAAVSTTNDPSP